MSTIVLLSLYDVFHALDGIGFFVKGVVNIKLRMVYNSLNFGVLSLLNRIEHQVPNLKVEGSSPSGSTIFNWRSRLVGPWRGTGNAVSESSRGFESHLLRLRIYFGLF